MTPDEQLLLVSDRELLRQAATMIYSAYSRLRESDDDEARVVADELLFAADRIDRKLEMTEPTGYPLLRRNPE